MTYLIQSKKSEYNKIKRWDSSIRFIIRGIKEVYKVLKVKKNI